MTKWSFLVPFVHSDVVIFLSSIELDMCLVRIATGVAWQDDLVDESKVGRLRMSKDICISAAVLVQLYEFCALPGVHGVDTRVRDAPVPTPEFLPSRCPLCSACTAAAFPGAYYR